MFVLCRSTNMSPTLLLLLTVVATVTAGKYVRIPQGLNWTEAQTLCRRQYTDLAPISSKYDMGLDDVWIGLNFLVGQWLWVDGQPFSYESWGASLTPSCPDMSFSLEGWNVHDCEVRRHFLCY
uniref:C-type lectin domain-containing protein n=1 Tax=Neogobius melanostomus TaxID=47308 RepID=A0A8C6TZ64_9GOBI